METKIIFKGIFAHLAKSKEIDILIEKEINVAFLIQKIKNNFNKKDQIMLNDALLVREGMQIKASDKINPGDIIIFLTPLLGGG